MEESGGMNGSGNTSTAALFSINCSTCLLLLGRKKSCPCKTETKRKKKRAEYKSRNGKTEDFRGVIN